MDEKKENEEYLKNLHPLPEQNPIIDNIMPIITDMEVPIGSLQLQERVIDDK